MESDKVMNWYGCLYCHTNIVDGKKYWGQTTKKNPKYRWNNGKGYTKSIFFYHAIQKYGWHNFQHDIVGYFLTKQELDDAETYWIKATRSSEPEYGYNLMSGGSIGKHSEETKIKISNALIGNDYNLGNKHTSLTKEKMSKAHKGKAYHTVEQLEIASKRMKEHPPALGIKRSKAYKKLMSDNKKKWWNKKRNGN